MALAERVDLAVTGMTCAHCAARVERQLNGMDGVLATVNLATNSARVDYDASAVRPEQLIDAVEGAGYGARIRVDDGDGLDLGEDLGDLERRLRVANGLTVPAAVLTLAPRLRFRGWQWACALAAAPVVGWAGASFHRRALSGLRHGTMSMDTLISLGTLTALGAGSLAVARGRDGHAYLETATGITVFQLYGRALEARARREAGEAVRSLLHSRPKEATRLEADGSERRIPAADVEVGDRLVIRPGEMIAADGTVDHGVSAVDEALLTGESTPREVGPGSDVAGGAVNAGGRLEIRATRVGADTALAGIARLVADAQAGKSSAQKLADRVAAVFVPSVIAAAALTYIGRRRYGEPGDALTPALSVLVVACPCALGLATPAALMVGVGRAAELGVFIRSPEVLEFARGIDTVLVDKTGTVTTGVMQLETIVCDESIAEEEALRLIAALESSSEHPVGRAIVRAAERVSRLPPPETFEALPGVGVQGAVDGESLVAGDPAGLEAAGHAMPDRLRGRCQELRADGATVVALSRNSRICALFALADTVRTTSREAIARLRELGLHIILLSGDHEAVAASVGAEVGVDEIRAEVLPSEKAALVRRLQADRHHVAMIGDGLNDAPALAAADLGIAIGAGAEVAIQASDLTLASNDLRGAATAIRLARETLRTIRGNLFWASAYNLVAIPAAAGGRLNPVVASASMAMSSVLVVTNSLRLRRFE